MSICLKNRSSYAGKRGATDWWEWTAYVECQEPDSLDDIKYVEYHLHETFPNPVRRVWSKQDGFPLSSEGWGTFKLKARVVFEKERRSPLILEHELKFEKPSPERGAFKKS
jgi:transcription initiation factor IIF auxiliary subunit